MSTKFFTNREENSLFKKFNGAFENISNIYAFHAVVGYFRASGYFPIREHLLRLPEVKILVGINVDRVSAEAKKRGLMFFGDPERSRDEFVKWMRQDIKEADYSKDVEEGILLFMQDIIDKKVLIKVHKTKKLHAKIYIFLPQNFNQYSGGEVITGSSNLTDAGLGLKGEGNYEFNVSLKDYDDIAFAEEEFQKLWEGGEDILPTDVARIKNNTHVGQLFTPFEIYIKLLIEYFGKSIDYDPDTVGDLPQTFKKLSYQIDAVNQGYDMLLKHDGFMLADVVGLGKTVVATLVAKRFLIANGTLNSKILVVYPPHLEKNWKSTFRQFKLDKHTRFISNGSLHKIIDGKSNDYWPKEDYDLVVVDEAHKFRNHKSRMFEQLQIICKSPRAVEGNVTGFRKKVMLISATPLNNRPEDIYYQLQLFTDARKSKLDITNLQSFFAPLIRDYKAILAHSRRTGKLDVDSLRKVYASIREKVLQPITVRRTRNDIKQYKAYKKDLDEQGIRFPEIAEPAAIEYKLGPGLESLFAETINMLVEVIGYYRYRAIEYLNKDIQEQFYSQAERASKTLAFIMMTQLVKRLESSFEAFNISIDRFRISTSRMIDMFQNGKIYVAPNANINELIDKGWDEDQIDEYIIALSAEDPKNQIFSPGDFKEEFIELLKADLDRITNISNKWKNVDGDPKLDVFLQLLKSELLRKDKNPTGKLVIFTESKDTARYLYKQLIEHEYFRTLMVSSENRKLDQERILANFDANYDKEQSSDLDILVTTEVLAEGINLHRANVLVNYDTPWNATRLMQRIGRINRIGSTAEVIYHYSFYPSKESDSLIKLYNNAYIKLQGFHTAYGEDAKIYSPEEILEEVSLHIKGVPEDEDKRLKYLEFIRNFKVANEKEFKRIAQLPLKARTARKASLSGKAEMSGKTLAFLKSSYKLEFFKISDKQTEPLTFVEAAGLFEARSGELSEQLPAHHYAHIQNAILTFESQLLNNAAESNSGDKADAKTNQAKKFIRTEKANSTDEKFRNACELLYEQLEKGIFTNLSSEINKVRLMFDKGKLLETKAHNLLISLALKFGHKTENDTEDEQPDLPIEITEKPDIIISETFLTP